MDAKLSLIKRELFGKKAKKLVQEGNVLGNIYGRGQNSISVYGDAGIVNKVINETGKNHPIDITLDDDSAFQALVHEVERDSITRSLHHVTFHIVKKGEKVTTEVPIHMIGEAPALKTGKIIVTLMDHIEVESTLANLPDALEVDVSGLVDEGDHVSVADLKVGKEVELHADSELLIAKVDIPRSQIEESAEEDEDTEGEDAANVPSEHGSDTNDE